MAEAKNVVIRQPNPGQGQGLMRAISQRTSWEYEHDETDAQIDTIEEIILGVRDEEAVGSDSSLLNRGTTFSWTSDTDKGEGTITLGTMYKDGDNWVSETWVIAPDGSTEEEVS